MRNKSVLILTKILWRRCLSGTDMNAENSPVIICLWRHQCNHVIIVNLLEKQQIMLIFSANLKQNNALFGNGSILFYSYVFWELGTNHLIFTGGRGGEGGGTGFEMMHAIFFRGPLYVNSFFWAWMLAKNLFLKNFRDESMTYSCSKKHDVQ